MLAKRWRICSGVMTPGSYAIVTAFSFPETAIIPGTSFIFSATSSISSAVANGVAKSPLNSARPPGFAAGGADAACVAVAGGRVAVGAVVGAVVAAVVAAVVGAEPAGVAVRGAGTGVNVEVAPWITDEKVGETKGVAARAVAGAEVGCGGTGNGVRALRAGASVAAAGAALVGAVPLLDGALAHPINATRQITETTNNKMLRNIVDSTERNFFDWAIEIASTHRESDLRRLNQTDNI